MINVGHTNICFVLESNPRHTQNYNRLAATPTMPAFMHNRTETCNLRRVKIVNWDDDERYILTFSMLILPEVFLCGYIMNICGIYKNCVCVCVERCNGGIIQRAE